VCKSQRFGKSLETSGSRIFFLRFLKSLGWYGFSYGVLADMHLFNQCFIIFTLLNVASPPPLALVLLCCQKSQPPPPPSPKKSIGARPYGFKNLYPSKKPATVTQQLTKSIDFRQNYVCDCHLRRRFVCGEIH
jgi:hypothetical protein